MGKRVKVVENEIGLSIRFDLHFDTRFGPTPDPDQMLDLMNERLGDILDEVERRRIGVLTDDALEQTEYSLTVEPVRLTHVVY